MEVFFRNRDNFERFPPVIKKRDFEIFKEVVRALQRKEHRDREEFKELVRRVFRMNYNGKQRRHRLDEVLRQIDTRDPQRLYARHQQLDTDIVSVKRSVKI